MRSLYTNQRQKLRSLEDPEKSGSSGEHTGHDHDRCLYSHMHKKSGTSADASLGLLTRRKAHFPLKSVRTIGRLQEWLSAGYLISKESPNRRAKKSWKQRTKNGNKTASKNQLVKFPRSIYRRNATDATMLAIPPAFTSR